MSINSSALIRFQKYDECLSFFQRNYTKEDILNELRKTESLQRKTSRDGFLRLGIEVNDRQFYKDLKTIEQVWDIKIDRIKLPKGKKIYRYSREDFSIFANLPAKNNLLKLRDSLFVLQQFKGLPQFEFLNQLFEQNREQESKSHQKTIVHFDENPDLVGLKYFSKLLNAIQLKQVLRITYNPSFKGKRTIILSPYFLKEYNNRWFLLCFDIRRNAISNMALDRIEHLEYATDEQYVETDVDFEKDFFEDVIGVTVNKKDPVDVLLKFSEDRFPYVASKPLHGSQKSYPENLSVKIKVIPNLELEALILHYGSDVEVLEPEDLRNEIKKRVTSMFNNYNSKNIV